MVPPWAVAAARAAIDAGAAMVVTNHPHVNQGMEVYAGKPIVYSPGNFILDQMSAAEVRSGYVLEIVLRNNGGDRIALPRGGNRGFSSATSNGRRRASRVDRSFLGGNGSPRRARRGSRLSPEPASGRRRAAA